MAEKTQTGGQRIRNAEYTVNKKYMDVFRGPLRNVFLFKREASKEPEPRGVKIDKERERKTSVSNAAKTASFLQM